MSIISEVEPLAKRNHPRLRCPIHQVVCPRRCHLCTSIAAANKAVEQVLKLTSSKAKQQFVKINPGRLQKSA